MEDNVIYLPAGSDLVKFIKDKEDTEVIHNSGLNIDWVWVINEAGTVKYRGEAYKVDKGDIFMLCYAPYIKHTGHETSRRAIILKSEDLYDNWLKCKQYYDRQDEEKVCSSCSGDCNDCDCGCNTGDSVAQESVN